MAPFVGFGGQIGRYDRRLGDGGARQRGVQAHHRRPAQPALGDKLLGFQTRRAGLYAKRQSVFHGAEQEAHAFADLAQAAGIQVAAFRQLLRAVGKIGAVEGIDQVKKRIVGQD